MEKYRIAGIKDEEMGNVIGGVDLKDVAAGLVLPTFLPGLGCGIASCVYFSKARKAKNNANMSDYEKYIKKSKNCCISAAILLGTSLSATVVAAVEGEKKKNGLQQQV